MFHPPPIRVLLVDDNGLQLRLFTAALNLPDIETESASSGAAALALLRADRFDLVILDMQMPHMTGAELAACLRAETCRLPLVLISGVDEDELVKIAARCGAVAWRRKPVELEDLRELVRRVGATGRDDRERIR